jgi:hypothetical protein
MDSVAAALSTLRTEALVSRILFWSALVVPVVAALVVWALRSRVPRSQRTRRALRALILWCSYSFVALFLNSCFIGDTGKRQLGRAVAAPVLAAIDQYHATVGGYPDSLPQLVPAYLTAARLHPPEERLLNGPLRYTRDSTGFILAFNYLGPGANSCDISQSGYWSCGGFY